MMKRLPSDAKFLMVTLLLVLLLGVRTATSLFEDDYAQDSHLSEAIALSALPLAEQGVSGRGPASISKAAVLPAPSMKSSLSALLSVDLSCSKKLDSTFKITGQFVQFKGKNCLKNFRNDKIEIVNQSNGSTALIFPYGENLYQTDLIQLKAGINEITIRHEAGGVKFEQTVKVSASAI